MKKIISACQPSYHGGFDFSSICDECSTKDIHRGFVIFSSFVMINQGMIMEGKSVMPTPFSIYVVAILRMYMYCLGWYPD